MESFLDLRELWYALTGSAVFVVYIMALRRP